VSDFVEEEHGRLIIRNPEGVIVKDAQCIIYPGANGDAWWEHMLWTHLDLQDKSHHLASEFIPPPFNPRPFLSPNMPVCTGPFARSLDASGMSRLLIVLMSGTFVLMFCGTYYGLILIC
jgi:hypothetical protein